MIKTAAFTIRVRDDVVRKLDTIAVLSDRSRACWAAKVIEDYVAREEWQLAEIQAGFDESDRRELATVEDSKLCDTTVKFPRTRAFVYRRFALHFLLEHHGVMLLVTIVSVRRATGATRLQADASRDVARNPAIKSTASSPLLTPR